MKTRARTLSAAVVLALSACASPPRPAEEGSTVAGLDATEKAWVSDALVSLAKERVGQGEIGVEAAKVDPGFSTGLVEALRHAGFDAHPGLAGPGHRLRFEVGPLGPDVLARFRLDDDELTMVLGHRQGGGLQLKSATTHLDRRPA